MKVNIVVTEQEYSYLHRKLFPPGDSNEHFGFGLAGINRCHGGCDLLLRKFISADSSCLLGKSGASVRPDPRFVDYVWTLAKKSSSHLIDFHTHPFSDINVSFSEIDDRSESESFPKAVECLGEGPHASIVLGKNSLDARWYNSQTNTLEPIDSVKILDDKLIIIIPTSSLQRRQILIERD